MIFMKNKKIICFITLLALLFCPLEIAGADESCATVSSGGEVFSYSSFEEAWNRAAELGNSGEVTFSLNKNWEADGTGSLGSGYGFSGGALSYSGRNNLTLDLNGCSIDRKLFAPTSNGAVIYVNSIMTITDSKSGEYTVSELFRGGAVMNGSNSARGGGIVIADNATLNMSGGTILNCVSSDDGGAISVIGSGAKLNVSGGAFYGNRTYDSSGECCGGAIYSSKATVDISNAVFEGNYAEDNGGAIYALDGSLSVRNSSFYSNSSEEEGGAISVDGSVRTVIRDSLFYANSSDDDGGAVYCDSDGGTYFYDCSMYYNHSASEGGAVHINDDKVFVIGGTYRYNTADEYGGGIYVDSMNDINAAGKLIIKDNLSKGKESDLCLQDGIVTTAYLYCGGFYEGSAIYLCSTGTGSRLAIKGIDKFQYSNYIRFDSGFVGDPVTTTAVNSNGIRAIASILGNGNVVYIVVSAVLIAALIIVSVVIKKKKEREKKDDQNQ